jgi:hypothetical protein
LRDEVDDECLVLILTQDLLEELVARAALVFEHARHAEAGIDQQSERQRQIGLAGEVFDGLRTAVFVQGEVFLGEVLDDLAALFVDGGKDVDDLDVGGVGGVGSGVGFLNRC